MPPLTAIRAFEAAARHQSFTAAAAELAMSQAAISYQVRRLEERLGVTLFHRHNRRVALTEDGVRISKLLSKAFDVIEKAVTPTNDTSVFTIATTSSFANIWLAQRLGAFQQANPHLVVRLKAANELADLQAGDADVAIRLGRGNWAPLVAERLLDIHFAPVCSPALRSSYGDLKPADLRDAPQLSPQDPWWRTWLRSAGVAVGDDEIGRGLRLGNQTECGNAARAGQGFGMLALFLITEDLRLGRLVQPFDLTASDGEAYWLVTEKHRRTDPRVRSFRAWLLAALAGQA